MNIIITSATALESKLLVQRRAEINRNISVTFHTSGVGILQSTFSLAKLLFEQTPDLLIQCGIAGTFESQAAIGKVVLAESDCLGSLGVEENGEWKDIFDNGFADADAFPFTLKKLLNPWLQQYNITNIPAVKALTVDEITTRQERIMHLKNKYNASIESMEGAPFHYVCLQRKIPFLQIRGISNQVGIRDKSQWRIQQALENMTNIIIDYLNKINT